ncbi:MAG: carbohydrate ABC transporter permease [Actinobacteria bacterium]|nr:carbohydrate ABC transporter permease [Actinomycetota bacterium]
MLPVIYMGITSFKPWDAIFKVPPTFKFQPTIASFVRLFYETRDYQAGKEPTPEEVAKMDWKNRLMWEQTNQKIGGLSEGPRRFLNSIIISIASTFFSVFLGTITAYAISRFRMKGKGDVMFFILSTRMLPAVVVTIPLFFMFKALHLTDTHVGLILLYAAFNVSFATWVMKGFMDDIPIEYEEAALVDGFTRMQAFRKVVLPQAATGIAATTIFCYIFSWNEYAFSLMMTSRVAQTGTVFIQGIKGSLGIDWGAIIAGSFLFFIPVAIFTFLMRRFLLAGITFGAIRK